MKSDELDKILNGALSAYSLEEPRPGLESRVLHRIRGRHEFSSRWMPWIFVAPALASLLVIAFLRRETRLPDLPQIAVNIPVVSFKLPLLAKAAPKSEKLPRDSRALPKQKEFPTPAPLTDQERILLAVMRRPPNETRRVFAELHMLNAEPIQIEEIHIDPLQDRGER